MSDEFVDFVRSTNSTDPLTDKKIWDELSKRAGFARISKMLTQTIRERQGAERSLRDVVNETSPTAQ